MRKQRFTDLGNARRLAARFRGRLKYVDSVGWFYWKDTHWSLDKSGQIERFASPDYARDLNSSEIWAHKKGRSSLI